MPLITKPSATWKRNLVRLHRNFFSRGASRCAPWRRTLARHPCAHYFVGQRRSKTLWREQCCQGRQCPAIIFKTFRKCRLVSWHRGASGTRSTCAVNSDIWGRLSATCRQYTASRLTEPDSWWVNFKTPIIMFNTSIKGKRYLYIWWKNQIL